MIRLINRFKAKLKEKLAYELMCHQLPIFDMPEGAQPAKSDIYLFKGESFMEINLN